MLAGFHHLLQRLFCFGHRGAAIPHCDAVGQDVPNSAAIEAFGEVAELCSVSSGSKDAAVPF